MPSKEAVMRLVGSTAAQVEEMRRESRPFLGRLTRSGLALPETVVAWLLCKKVDVEVDVEGEVIRVRPGDSYTMTMREPSKQGIVRSKKLIQQLAVIGIGVGDRVIFTLGEECVGAIFEFDFTQKDAILGLKADLL